MHYAMWIVVVWYIIMVSFQKLNDTFWVFVICLIVEYRSINKLSRIQFHGFRIEIILFVVCIKFEKENQCLYKNILTAHSMSSVVHGWRLQMMQKIWNMCTVDILCPIYCWCGTSVAWRCIVWEYWIFCTNYFASLPSSVYEFHAFDSSYYQRNWFQRWYISFWFDVVVKRWWNFRYVFFFYVFYFVRVLQYHEITLLMNQISAKNFRSQVFAE